jgi:hypothetical protein
LIYVPKTGMPSGAEAITEDPRIGCEGTILNLAVGVVSSEKCYTEIQKAEADECAFPDEVGQEGTTLFSENACPSRCGPNVDFEVGYARYSIKNYTKMVLKHQVEGC